MSANVIDLFKRRRERTVTEGLAYKATDELRRALNIVHAAVEEYRRDYRSARLNDGEVVKLLDAFGHYLSGREVQS